MATTYRVKKGDTLSQIAQDYKFVLGSNLTNKQRVNKLVQLNHIKDPNYIVVGQVLIIDPVDIVVEEVKNTSYMCRVNVFGLQSNTDRTVYASWVWHRSYTENYKIRWFYDTGDGKWWIGEDSTAEFAQSTYTAPSNAKRVKFFVKPISKKHKVNNKEVSYWKGEWSTAKYYSFSSNPPTQPTAPTVTIEKYKLTAELNNLDINATKVEFQVIKDDKSTFRTGTVTVKTKHASYSCTISPGYEYKVRCRGVKGNVKGPWSEYSGNSSSIPATPKSILYIKALSSTVVQLKWERVKSAKSFEIEYTTDKRYFNSSSAVSTVTSDSPEYAEITGLETGQQYFFRVRSVNEQGSSPWTEPVTIILGKPPSAPTTWSSSSTVITGEPLTLYWVHNSLDGSSQTYAELELTINGTTTTKIIKNSTNEDEKDKTSVYDQIDTSLYTEGTRIKWRVRTSGITNEYGDWSVMRTVDIYAPPTLELAVTDVNGDAIETLTGFPMYISGVAGPTTQDPIGYHLSVISNTTYETNDQVGVNRIVSEGDEIYSKYFDTDLDLLVELSANNIDLENNAEYSVICTVSMNSGLSASAQVDFTVGWTENEVTPNAEIIYDPDTYSANIRPYCEDTDENLIEGITLSVYRREFDGGFTEIGTGIENTKLTFVTDPHPALDYARYRVVAIDSTTGAVSYCDLPGEPILEPAVIIQWDETWIEFDIDNEIEDEMEVPAWSGSLLKLPYNIDVSDSHAPDSILVKYIGRKHPVSYYGTQLGSTATWNVDVVATDQDTLYALRRLANYMGDVYVREPSGSGYWASIKVSFSRKHTDLVIPVTLNITRVEGGM